VGYTQLRQGSLTERSVLSLTNFIPGGRGFFAYQAAEFDLKGPANGTAEPGLSYFLANVRVSPAARLELQGTYNRGHSLDARRLTDDLLNDRPLTAQAIEGLRYESAGGRVTVQIARQVFLYAGYARDRNNRDDEPTGSPISPISTWLSTSQGAAPRPRAPGQMAVHSSPTCRLVQTCARR